MTVKIETPVRVFKIGSISLSDPDPSLPPEEAVRLYAGSYPQVMEAEISGPDVGPDGSLVYTVERPAVKTKG